MLRLLSQLSNVPELVESVRIPTLFSTHISKKTYIFPNRILPSFFYASYPIDNDNNWGMISNMFSGKA